MNNVSKSFCIDYFMFRVDGRIDIPNNEQEYLEDCKTGDEPGTNDFDFINELCRILLIKPFIHYDTPNYRGYKYFSTFDEDITIYGGRKAEESSDGEMRSYVELRGHALRMFELRCLDAELDVFEQYRKLFNFCAHHMFGSDRHLHMNRIDCTLDDYSNLISIKELQEKLRNGYYVSKSKKFEQNLDYNKQDQENDVHELLTKGWTAYVGSSSSRKLCIYDKKAERESAGNNVIVNTWLRYEARFYSTNADTAFSCLYHQCFKDGNSNDFNKVIGSLINVIITFKEDNKFDNNHQYMAPDWNKWLKLLDPTDISFITQASKEKDISFKKKKEWLIKSPYMNFTLEFLCDCDFYYDDLGIIQLKSEKLYSLFEDNGISFNDKFLMFCYGLLNRGKKKLNEQKLAVVNNLRKSKGYSYINNLTDARKLINDYVGNYDDLGFYFFEDMEEEEC